MLSWGMAARHKSNRKEKKGGRADIYVHKERCRRRISVLEDTGVPEVQILLFEPCSAFGEDSKSVLILHLEPDVS